jgi:hypothetical protein
VDTNQREFIRYLATSLALLVIFTLLQFFFVSNSIRGIQEEFFNALSKHISADGHSTSLQRGDDLRKRVVSLEEKVRVLSERIIGGRKERERDGN